MKLKQDQIAEHFTLDQVDLMARRGLREEVQRAVIAYMESLPYTRWDKTVALGKITREFPVEDQHGDRRSEKQIRELRYALLAPTPAFVEMFDQVWGQFRNVAREGRNARRGES